jgi:hypothetical protein
MSIIAMMTGTSAILHPVSSALEAETFTKMALRTLSL